MRMTISILLIILLVCSVGVAPAYATETTSTKDTTSDSFEQLTAEEIAELERQWAIEDPWAVPDLGQSAEISIGNEYGDKVVYYFYGKGYDIIHFLQKVVQPFAIIIFIIGAFMALLGSLGNGMLAGKGFWGMSVSVVMYAVVLYSPLIMQTMVGWVTT